MNRQPDWRKLLRKIDGTPMADMVARRIVCRQNLERQKPIDYLFTSGRPGRYNPRGVLSVYASDNLITAGAEWERYWDGRPQSYLVYSVKFSVLILDLGDSRVLNRLKLKSADLHAPWRGTRSPTPCQRLGKAVAMQKRIAGIRFPSDAAREKGIVGFNFVLFKNAVVAPSKVEVSNDEGAIVQRWP